jgi:NAD(P)-dependent dehydrogenase (short-subunit alcohol dehydrogenase family)
VEGLLQGKVALVTGAATSIGRAASLVFARQGARIVAADLDPAAAAITAGQVRDSGGEAIARRCDVHDAADLEALVAATAEAFGRLDIVFINAGIAIRPKSPQTPSRSKKSESAIARYYSISIEGVRNSCRAALRQFDAQGGGGVVLTTDLAARLIDYGNVRYDPSKSAVAVLTRTLALEAAEQGTRVNAFCPAGMATSRDDDEGAIQQSLPGTVPNPLGQPVTPEACANAALFLVSDLAAMVTGVNLPVDGGVAAALAHRG